MNNIFEDKVKYFTRVPVSLLKVDHSYQKPLNMSHAKKIAKEFNPLGVNQIHVSRREDGSYYVFDGQHRLCAYKIMEIDTIETITYEGMTVKEEAIGYDLYNTIKTQTPLDKEKALIVAKDEGALKRKGIVEGLGLEIDYQNTKRVDYIQAVGAIKSIYEKGEQGDLETVLYVIKESLGTHKKNYQAMIMLGFHEFIKQYRFTYEKKWLINRLTRFGLDELLTEQMTFRRAHNCSRSVAIKHAMVRFYNHGKREENRL